MIIYLYINIEHKDHLFAIVLTARNAPEKNVHHLSIQLCGL